MADATSGSGGGGGGGRPRILRGKGVLALGAGARKFIFQSVEEYFDLEEAAEGSEGAEWGSTEARESRVVLIGWGLEREALQRGLEACLQSASVFSGRSTVFPDSGLPAALAASPGLAQWDLPPAPARALLAAAAVAPQDERWEGVWEGCGQAVDIFE